MTITEFKIEGLLMFQPTVFSDDRGRFIETFNSEILAQKGFNFTFKQDNESISKEKTFRGIHLQTGKHAQGKLVRVAKGAVIDFAVDLRQGSATFGQWESVLLTGELGNQFWVPPGFGHAFLALEDDTIFCYKCTEVYNKEAEVCIRYDDPAINLDLDFYTDMLVSDKDKRGITLQEYKNQILSKQYESNLFR